jgi:SAM-dependent methyltransferase
MSAPASGSSQSQPAAFDAFAGEYDRSFTNSALGRMLRARVWEEFARQFPPASHVLELACGTGEDAVWLARRGVNVAATDGSPEMVRAAQSKVTEAGLADRVRVLPLTLQNIIDDPQAISIPGGYAGALSNFGGLNTIAEWDQLACALAGLVAPAGKLVLVPMGPVCPWEIGWYLLHRQPQLALRRFRQPAIAVIGDARIPIWYPSAGQLRRAFAPWFSHRNTRSLGLWLPTSSLSRLVDRAPRLFALANRLETATARLSAGWGDHYIMVLERR